jgi:biopolymer transport protein ExbD
VLTLLILFLLRSWSMDPPVRVEPGFELPVSGTEEDVRPRCTVDVGRTIVRVDGRRVVGTRYYERSEDRLVREVYEVVLLQGGAPVALRVDASVPWSVVQKVLFTLDLAGVEDVELVAVSGASL